MLTDSISQAYIVLKSLENVFLIHSQKKALAKSKDIRILRDNGTQFTMRLCFSCKDGTVQRLMDGQMESQFYAISPSIPKLLSETAAESNI